MIREKICIECGISFPRKSMIYSTKTNPYGDKTIKGYICTACYKKRIEKRSKILLIFSFTFIGICMLLLFTLFWVYFFAEGFTEDQFMRIAESFFFMGVFMLGSGLFLFYLRRKELSKMRNQIKLL